MRRALGRRRTGQNASQEAPGDQNRPGGRVNELLGFVEDAEAGRNATLLLWRGAGQLGSDRTVRGVLPEQTCEWWRRQHGRHSFLLWDGDGGSQVIIPGASLLQRGSTKPSDQRRLKCPRN
jgi:hypothetical protein